MNFRLISTYENSFTEGKLRDELEKHFENTDIREQNQEPITNLEEQDFDPVKFVEELNRKKNLLYKEAINDRNMLVNICKDEISFTGYSLTVAEMTKLMEQTDKMGNPIPFSLVFVTWNNSTQKGGDLRQMENMELTSINKTGTKQKRPRRSGPYISSKSPNHWKNSTRNIKPVYGHDVTKINIWLVMAFNGHPVTM